MKTKTFIIVGVVICLILVLLGIFSMKNDKIMLFKEAKLDSIYVMVDSLSRQCHRMDSIIKVQDSQIKSLTSTQSAMEKRLDVNDKKIKENNRIAINAIRGLALKYTIDYYGGY